MRLSAAGLNGNEMCDCNAHCCSVSVLSNAEIFNYNLPVFSLLPLFRLAFVCTRNCHLRTIEIQMTDLAVAWWPRVKIQWAVVFVLWLFIQSLSFYLGWEQKDAKQRSQQTQRKSPSKTTTTAKATQTKHERWTTTDAAKRRMPNRVNLLVLALFSFSALRQ